MLESRAHMFSKYGRRYFPHRIVLDVNLLQVKSIVLWKIPYKQGTMSDLTFLQLW
jgi:hypothetical protein